MRTVNAKPSADRGRRRRKGRGQSWLVTVFCPRALSTGGLAPGYFAFQLYDTLQGLCSYLRSVLCNRGLLRALGVGTETASATAAALTFLTRDGVGMLASLGLAFACSQSFGREVKFWRLFADVCNDVALVLDLVAPWYGNDGSVFLLLVCVSSALKAFCGVAAGATRAAITSHFAISANDLADVAAKEGSQETAVTLLGMLLGYWFLDHVSEDDFAALWGLFAVLTMVHVWANFQAVSNLHFRTLDEQRLGIVLAAHQRQLAVLSFEQVSQNQSIALPWPSSRNIVLHADLPHEQAVWVNDLLPDVGFVDVDGRVGVVVAEDGTEDELVDQQVCAALALLSSSSNAQHCARTAHEHLALVRELKALGWDLPASCTLLRFSKHKRAKFKQL